ncbi:hypothetical protein PCC7418_0554 [Halothece sp. PCC 7418]|uniref:hypothetical protein n=1 Tax=Halothece sp. (strain PCC 7418) TaxID=65093 RepID=UPI0002A07869|nr:hypothetical protein [Halothece sp. PCC 7418]AFZ42783.1 hypothetical protein PCC7418_0554 [Halothece sp. PCC 7418]
MTSIQTTDFQRNDLDQNPPIDHDSPQDLTKQQDTQEANHQLQIDIAIIKFVIGAVIFDTVFFLIF